VGQKDVAKKKKKKRDINDQKTAPSQIDLLSEYIYRTGIAFCCHADYGSLTPTDHK
jgi:hypothetical protein